MRKNLLLFLILIIYNVGQSQAIDTLINVGNHKLHFTIIKGKGTPILFEAGNGDDGSTWQTLPNEIHKQTNATVITYDRAGLGKSEIDTTKISFQNEVKDLEIALKKIGYSKKIFIVCHSFGGYYASLFTYQNLKKIKGVVCIDIATPCFFTKKWSDEFIQTIKEEDWKMIKQYKPGLFYTLKNFSNTAEFMQDKFLSPKTPVTMIMAENIQPMIKEEEKGKWINCCKKIGTMQNHSFVVAKNADHKVWEKNPTIVIEEIVKLYKKVK
ncbi:MAG: alpha/beta hydrolase [Limnohabitans sp.]|nr:alpha/beta hydrolase [Limnohabitans sp.]